MIRNDNQLSTILDRIRQLQQQLVLLRTAESNPFNDRLSSSGFITEVDRMQLEVREYLSTPASVSRAGLRLVAGDSNNTFDSPKLRFNDTRAQAVAWARDFKLASSLPPLGAIP